MHTVPLVCSFILQHCNMDPATNLHVWSRTNAQKQLVKSARLVHLLRKSSALTFLQELDILESSVNDKAIVHIYLHPYKSASTCFNYVTLKNNHAPSAKTHSQSSRNCTFGLLKRSNIKVNFWRMRTWDIG